MNAQQILNSNYLDLIFLNRNKAYGGYELRLHDAKRSRTAFFLVFAGALLLALFLVLKSISAAANEKIAPHISEGPTILTILPIEKVKAVEHEKSLASAAAAPAKTIANPSIKIVPNELVKATENPPETSKLEKSISGPTSHDGNPDGSNPFEGKGKGNGPEIHTPVGGGNGLELPEIATVVDQVPSYNGSLNAFLKSNLTYPDMDREMGNMGRVLIKFIINEDGSVAGVSVARTSGFTALDAEAIRVVSLMRGWEAGRINGKKVRSYFTLPIVFRLD